MIIHDRSSDDAAILEAIARETHRVDGYPKYMPDDLRSFIVDEDALGAWVAQNDHEILGHVAAIALYEREVWTSVGKVDWSRPGDRLLREFDFLSPEPG